MEHFGAFVNGRGALYHCIRRENVQNGRIPRLRMANPAYTIRKSTETGEMGVLGALLKDTPNLKKLWGGVGDPNCGGGYCTPMILRHRDSTIGPPVDYK